MKKLLFLLLMLPLAAVASLAQRAAAPIHNTQPGAVVPVAQGQSVVALNGLWRFRIGDDPRWADPGFGKGILVNAGHLPPYLNGKELPIEGALPLGMVTTPSFSSLQFDFKPSDQILLISDGVVEAQNDGGQLFGFERIRQMLANRESARHLANAAARFGQEDDITVLSITRTKSRQEALA